MNLMALGGEDAVLKTEGLRQEGKKEGESEEIVGAREGQAKERCEVKENKR